MPQKQKTNGTKRILAFLATILVIVRKEITGKLSVPESRINKLVSNGILCASLNHHHQYIASMETVKKSSDKFGFFRAKAGKDNVIFHVKRKISDVLAYLVQRMPWGFTQQEAMKRLGRDCGKQLNKLVDQRRIRRVNIHGTWLYVHLWHKKAALQINERAKNPKYAIKEPKTTDKPPIFIEEIMNTFQDLLIKGQEQGMLDNKLSLSKTATLLLMSLKDQTYRSIETLLRINERLQQACGINGSTDILDHSTYCRYFNSDILDVVTLQEIITLLVKGLKKEGVVKGNIVAVDATHIFAWFNRYRPEDEMPEGASKAFHGGFFKGYKAHMLVDAHSELPLAIVIKTGTSDDCTQVIPIIDQLENRMSPQDIMVLLGDGGYHFPKKIEKVEERIGGYMCTAINPRRNKTLQKIKKQLEKIVESFGGKPPSVKAVLDKFSQKLLTAFGLKEGNKQESILIRFITEIVNRNLRLSVERVWSRLKHWTSFERPRTTDNNGVRRNALWCIISMLILALTAQKTGKEGSMRSFSCIQ